MACPVPVHLKSVVEVARLIQERKLSSVQITKAVLARIQELQPRLNAFASLQAENALAQARAADEEMKVRGPWRGPLHGVPLAVKEIFAIANVPNRAGSAALGDNIPDKDCTVVSRLREAGAVILGSVRTTECAMSGYSDVLQNPIPRNPWGNSLWSGSSSSGSGVSVSAGLAYSALGSDTAGSIRFPASSCGVVGLKPTRGLCSRHGVIPLAETLDTVGTLTRCAADAAIVLQAIGGYDPSDITSIHHDVPKVFDFKGPGDSWQLLLGRDYKACRSAITSQLGRPLRIGICHEYNTNGVDSVVANAVSQVAKQIAEISGGTLGEIDMGWSEKELSEYMDSMSVLLSSQGLLSHRATWPQQKELYGNFFQKFLEFGERTTSKQVAKAMVLKERCTGRLDALFHGPNSIDVLICPATISPPPLDERVTRPELLKTDERKVIEGPEGPYTPLLYGRFTIPFNLSGHPCLTMPCGLTPEHTPRPLAFQLVGPRLGEKLLCEIGHMYEDFTETGFRAPLAPPVDS